MRMSTKRFSRRLHMLISDDESAMLDELAVRDGMTPSEVIRRMIRRAYAELGDDRPAKPKPKPKPKRKPRKTSRG